MQQITFTEFKKLTMEQTEQMLPFEVTFNSEPKFRVVPKTWRDPRFTAMLAERDLVEKSPYENS